MTVHIKHKNLIFFMNFISTFCKAYPSMSYSSYEQRKLPGLWYFWGVSFLKISYGAHPWISYEAARDYLSFGIWRCGISILKYYKNNDHNYIWDVPFIIIIEISYNRHLVILYDSQYLIDYAEDSVMNVYLLYVYPRHVKMLRS